MGSLTTVLTTDLRQFEAGLKRAKQMVETHARDIQKMGSIPIGGGARGAGGGRVQSAEREAQQLIRTELKLSADRRRIAEEAARQTARIAQSETAARVRALAPIREAGAAIGRGLAVGAAAGLAGLTALVSKGIELNRLQETQRLGLASVLSLTSKLVDERGRELPIGKTIAENLREAAELQKAIRLEAAKSILTERELAQAFTANVGLAQAQGIGLKDSLTLISRIAQLTKTILPGAPEAQVAQEIRSLLTGQGLQASTISRALSISSEDLQKARESGRLLAFLLDKFKAGEPLIAKFGSSFEGVTSTLRDKLDSLLRGSTSKFFDQLTRGAGDLNKFLDAGKIESWSQTFSDGLIGVVSHFQALGTAIKEVKGLLAGTLGGDLSERILTRRTTPLAERRVRTRDLIRERQRDLAGVRRRIGEQALLPPWAPGMGAELQRERAMRQERLATAQREAERLRTIQDRPTPLLSSFGLTAPPTGPRRVPPGAGAADLARRQEANKERIDVAQQIATLIRDKVAGYRAEAEAAKLKASTEIKDAGLRAKVLVAIDSDMVRKIREVRAEAAEKEREDLTKRRQIQQSVKEIGLREIDLQTDVADKRQKIREQQLSAERHFHAEQRRLLKERRDAEHDLTRAIQKEEQARQDLRLGQEERGIRSLAEAAIKGSRIFQEIEREQVDRLRRSGLGAEQARGLGRIRAEGTTREIAGALGQGELGQARDILGGLGVEINTQELRQLADLAQQGGLLGMRREEIEQRRGAEEQRQAVAESQRGVAEAGQRVIEVAQREREAREAFVARQKELAAELQDTQRNYRRSVLDFLGDTQRLSETFRALQMALPRGSAQMPSPSLGALEEIRQANVATALPAMGAVAGATTINHNYSLDGVQLGSDTKELLRQLEDKLRRDSRRTP